MSDKKIPGVDADYNEAPLGDLQTQPDGCQPRPRTPDVAHSPIGDSRQDTCSTQPVSGEVESSVLGATNLVQITPDQEHIDESGPALVTPPQGDCVPELPMGTVNVANVLRLLPDKDAVVRTLLLLALYPEGQGLPSHEVEELLSLPRRTRARVKKELLKRDWAVVAPAPGSDREDIWTLRPSIRETLVAMPDGDHAGLHALACKGRSRMPSGPNPYEFGGRKYGSVCERDVAVVLAALGARTKPQARYREILSCVGYDWVANETRDWRADFLVVRTAGESRAWAVVEVAGVRGDPSYKATLRAKERTCLQAGVPWVSLGTNLTAIPEFIDRLDVIVGEREKLRKDEAGSRVPNSMMPHTTAGGVYVDPRAVNDGRRHLPPCRVVHEESSGPWEQLPAERAIRQAREALDAKRDVEWSDAKRRLRAAMEAAWAAEDEADDREAEARLLVDALAWKQSRFEEGLRREEGLARDVARTHDAEEALRIADERARFEEFGALLDDEDDGPPSFDGGGSEGRLSDAL
jgi:hypothetical protein